MNSIRPMPAAAMAATVREPRPTGHMIASLAELALLVGVLVLPSIVVVSTGFPLSRVALLAYVFVGLFRLATRRRGLSLDPLTKRLFIFGSLLSIYMLCVDLYQNDPVQGLEDLIKRTMFLGLLPASDILGQGDFGRIRRVIQLSLFQFALATAQIFDPSLTQGRLWPDIPFLRSAGSVSGLTGSGLSAFTERSGRVVGASNTAIGIGLLAGMVFVLILLYTSGARRVVLGLWALIVVYFTYTRSAVWGIAIPVVMILAWQYRRPEQRARLVGIVLSLVLIAGGLAGGIWLSRQFSTRAPSERLWVASDVNTLAKLAAAYAGIVDTLQVSPFIGIAQSDVYQSFVRGYATLPEDFFPADEIYLDVTITNHNQLIWYLRYYGLIGLAFIIYIHWLVWQKIRAKSDPRLRLALSAIFLYFFQFSLLHNTFLLADVPFWLLLGVGAATYATPPEPVPASPVVGPRPFGALPKGD